MEGINFKGIKGSYPIFNSKGDAGSIFFEIIAFIIWRQDRAEKRRE